MTPQRDSYNFRITNRDKDTTLLLSNPCEFISPHTVNPNSHFHQFKDKAFIHFPFSDIVWEVTENGTTPCYKLILGDKGTPPIEYMQRIGKGKRDYTRDLFQSGYVYTYRLLETSDYLQVTYMSENMTYFGFYNKKSKESYTYKFPEFIQASGLTGLRDIVGTYQDYFIGIIEPSILKRNNPPHEELKKISEEISPEDNPVLCLFKFKGL